MLCDVLSAFALLLVFEGLLPSLCPKCWRQSVTRLLNLNDEKVRIIGFVSMMAGLILFYVVKQFISS